MRENGRSRRSLRKVKVITDYIEYAEGSCLIQLGKTKIVCTASVEENVPPFLRNQNSGWITAEYGMIPRACRKRVSREISRGKPDGRSQEIQRLIGRSLRSVVDLGRLGKRTIWVDCDVIQADGSTRCAAITGSFVALYAALEKMKKDGLIEDARVKDFVAAVSVGIIDGKEYLDLDYDEDTKADVDMNVVMTGGGRFIEIQGTAEKEPFGQNKLNALLKLAQKGIADLIDIQKAILIKKPR